MNVAPPPGVSSTFRSPQRSTEDIARDPEAEAGAFAGGLGGEQRREDRVLDRIGHARPSIDDADREAAVVDAGSNVDGAIRAPRSCDGVRSVGDQVSERLSETPGVGPQRHGAGQIEVELRAASGEAVAQKAAERAQLGAQIERLPSFSVERARASSDALYVFAKLRRASLAALFAQDDALTKTNDQLRSGALSAAFTVNKETKLWNASVPGKTPLAHPVKCAPTIDNATAPTIVGRAGAQVQMTTMTNGRMVKSHCGSSSPSTDGNAADARSDAALASVTTWARTRPPP